MCGFAGCFGNAGGRDIASIARVMAETMVHRGPDDAGVWADADAGIALGHRRLAVLDVSPAGHQPMISSCDRYVIAFNGEIYNNLAIRREIDGEAGQPIEWRGHSDTETLLTGIVKWGLRGALGRSVGMFSVAVWDRRDRVLWLARDRFGEKPLYFGWVGKGFVFGSELKALRAHPQFANPICREALSQYLRFMYVPAPLSIYQGIYKLEPGCLLRIEGPSPGTAPTQPLRPPSEHGAMTMVRWWSLGAVIEEGANESTADELVALEVLEEKLTDAIRLQSVADVPLGAFLSGGVDSSTIVALMQQQASRPVKTFTVGFEEGGFDESPHARLVAGCLGTEHTELFVTAAEARAVISRLPEMYDEPFADSSQIPTHLVCSAARQHVTVAISGDAGDELFGGYNRYFWGPRIWDRLAWIPYPARRLLGGAIQSVPIAGWDALDAVMLRRVRGGNDFTKLGDKAHKLAARLKHVRTMDELYMSLVTEWPIGDGLVRGVVHGGEDEYDLPVHGPVPGKLAHSAQLGMMYRDSLSYLPDDILCKVDRAAMAASLETRVPFLDHRVVEAAWRLPLAAKIRGNEGKWALRQILYKHVPRELIERPKAGFGIPVGEWLRGPLKDWAESLLEPDRLDKEGYLDPIPIRKAWLEHLGGSRDWTHRLWGVLMFQSWLEIHEAG